jgi:ubiquinol-cytochrome c reductase iron-sulfur subunit
LAGGAVFLLSEAFGGTADQDATFVDVDLSRISSGKSATVKWAGKLVFVRHRTAEEVRAARTTAIEALVDPQRDEARVHRPDWIVVVGECTHAGCKPIEGLGDYGGWLCLCHGSDFDTSGRVRKGPAVENLEVPPHTFLSENVLRIGKKASSHSNRE